MRMLSLSERVPAPAMASGRDPPASAKKKKAGAPARSVTTAGRDPPAKKVAAGPVIAGRDPPKKAGS